MENRESREEREVMKERNVTFGIVKQDPDFHWLSLNLFEPSGSNHVSASFLGPATRDSTAIQYRMRSEWRMPITRDCHSACTRITVSRLCSS